MIYEITDGTLDTARAVALTAALPAAQLVSSGQQMLIIKLVDGARLCVFANHGFTMSDANISAVADAAASFAGHPAPSTDANAIRAQYRLDGSQVVEGAIPAMTGEDSTPIGYYDADNVKALSGPITTERLL